MKKHIRFLSLFIASALISGCGSTTPLNETETTTAAAETTTAMSERQTTVSLAETTEKPAVTDSESSQKTKYKSISDVPAGELYEYRFYDWKVNTRDITRINGDYIFTETPSYLARASSGMLSAECDEQFTTAVENTHININENFYFDEKRIKVTEITEDTIYTGEENVSYNSSNNIMVKYAFVKKNSDTDYEFIIDPACMDDIPLWSPDTDFMKFEVNGTEFYGDTIKVTSSFSNTLSDINTDDYVYAKVIFAHLWVQCNTESGYICSADLYSVKTITTDTDSVIDRSFFDEYYKDNETYKGLKNAKSEIEALDKPQYYFSPQLMLVDLDFDGTDEILIPHYTSDYFLNHQPVNFYDTENGKLIKLDTIAINSLQEAYYDGKRGWVIHYNAYNDISNPTVLQEEGYMFISLKGGKIEKEILCGKNFESDKFYYLGEEVVPEITESTNPYSGEEMNIYEWNGYKHQGWLYEFFEKIMEGTAKKYFAPDSEQIFIASHSPYSLEYLPFETASLNLIIKADLDKQKEADVPVAEFVYKEVAAEKPVLYLYPEKETNVSVKVQFPYGGQFTCTYPEYNVGWNVTAMPDGTIYDRDGNEYYCLYWEADLGRMPSSNEGFCVKGEDTAEFLREKLMGIGLTARETNEFIIYWLPRMQDNEYNIISFHTDEYNNISPLEISPAPDTLIRVFMTYYGSDKPIDIEPQLLPEYERNGFTAVEWGGSEIK